MSDLLTVHEATALAEHEQVIERGIQTFTEVGNALLKIRDGRLYRADFGAFEDYCRERWGFSRQRAQQLTSAAQAVTTIVATGLPTPANEGQARELARVPEPDRAEVWRETLDRTDGKPTAAAIRETYRPEPEPTPEPPAPEPGIWHSGPPADQERADAAVAKIDDDARRDAELDAVMDGTVQRFRANFARARRQAAEVTTFDADRIGEVFGGNWDREVGDLLWRLRQWCDAVESAHRRQSSGLRVVQGGTQ